jgi:predicted lipoprotein with Yx(FWY)xxD motif
MQIFRNGRKLQFGALMLSSIVALAMAGCGDKDPDANTAYSGKPGAATKVTFSGSASATVLSTKKSKLGEIAAGQSDRTLYSYLTDDGKPPTCRGECAWTWLPLVQGVGVRVSGNIDRTKVGAVKFSQGTEQLTYGGHPLYYYSRDENAKSVLGHGLEHSGATWLAVSSAGKLVPAPGSAAP